MAHKLCAEVPSQRSCELPPSIERLIVLLQSQTIVSPQQVCQAVLDAKIQPEELLPWATFDHLVGDSYGRKLVYDGQYFEIMVMSWLPGDCSAIHDHGFAQWGAVQYFGEAEHITYHLDDTSLDNISRDKPSSDLNPTLNHDINTSLNKNLEQKILHTDVKTTFYPGDVAPVDHDLIHQMGNAGQTPFLSLHVYGAPYFAGPITGDARIFDLLEESIQYTDGGVFFGLPEDAIKQRDYGLRADSATMLRHHQLMYDRLNKMRSVTSELPDPLALKLNLLAAYLNF